QDVQAYNNPEIRGLEIPAATGVATARALAKLHSLMVERKLVKESTLIKLSTPATVNQLDLLLAVPVSTGKGFFYTKNPQDQWLVGHPGRGGQNVKMDITNRVAIAYLCNGIKAGFGEYTAAYKHLQDALYRCLEDNKLLYEPPPPPPEQQNLDEISVEKPDTPEENDSSPTADEASQQKS
ncbi:unnamed protein product, partial [Gongylonema pulchrum]|uniref:Beta-lactamase domain-containing protein n=1 Tax=Gongylonema pulchrum TaxID=637853 RepID=A0A183D158_9BILA